MFSNYRKLDSKFLTRYDKETEKKLSDYCLSSIDRYKKKSKEYRQKVKELNVKEILDKNLLNIWVFHCPYCKLFAFLELPKIIDEKPIFCVVCGEANPHNKIKQSLSKTKTLLKLSKLVVAGDKAEADINTERTLLEQCIVMIATGIEVFLRDIYSTVLNIRYIQSDKSLFERFYKGSRNDFINMGKSKKKFQDDLNINITRILGKENYGKLNLLMLKRHVIVHNIGIADKSFISQSGIECKLKSPIPIQISEVEEYIRIVQKFADNISSKFEKEFEKEMIQRLKFGD